MSWYIGIMSGTSLDAIDVALCKLDIINGSIQTRAFHSPPFPDELLAKLTVLCTKPIQHLENIGQTQQILTQAYADAVNNLLTKENIDPASISAIGCHGQTIWHSPASENPFTWQLLDPALLARLCKIDVVHDFRAKDMAYGGQGAPLVPPFHQWLCKDFPARFQYRVLVNIGGIANVSIFNKERLIAGFDTGPGNTLLDMWHQRHKIQMYDKNGAWAATGNNQPELLTKLLSDPYFAQPAPKSTGREYFNLDWLQECLNQYSLLIESTSVDNTHMHSQPMQEAQEDSWQPYSIEMQMTPVENLTKVSISPKDMQRTLSMLTAQSILDSVQTYTKNAPTQMILCGGGTHNKRLCADLSELLPNSIEMTLLSSLGHNPDAIEAMAFAWLAACHESGIPSNAPSLTGASKAVVLGSKTSYK